MCVDLCKWLHRTIFNYLQDHYCDLCGFKLLHRSTAVRIHLKVGVAGTNTFVYGTQRWGEEWNRL